MIVRDAAVYPSVTRTIDRRCKKDLLLQVSEKALRVHKLFPGTYGAFQDNVEIREMRRSLYKEVQSIVFNDGNSITSRARFCNVWNVRIERPVC